HAGGEATRPASSLTDIWVSRLYSSPPPSATRAAAYIAGDLRHINPSAGSVKRNGRCRQGSPVYMAAKRGYIAAVPEPAHRMEPEPSATIPLPCSASSVS